MDTYLRTYFIHIQVSYMISLRFSCRVFFLLFRQEDRMEVENIDTTKQYFEARGGLCTCEWASKKNYGVPVGINGFVTKWDESVDDMHEKIGYMPPAEYQSPRQMSKYALLEQERVRLAKLKVEEEEQLLAQKEKERKATSSIEESRREIILETINLNHKAQEKAKAMKTAAAHDPILSLMIEYDIETRAVFEGIVNIFLFTHSFPESSPPY